MKQASMPAAPRRTVRYRLDGWLRERDREAGNDRTRRFRDAVLGIHGGNDWGHRLMALVGRDDTGSWGVPRVRDLYFREVHEKGGRELGIPGRSLTIVTRDGWEAWQGVRRGEETWRAFDCQNDGHTIRVGYLGSDGRLHDSGIDGRRELAMFRRWLLWDGWVKAEWFGLRRWLYFKGLHAAVNRKYPFTCQVTPPHGSGGYDHWYCTVDVGVLGTVRRWLGKPVDHPMPHRYMNYRWDGEGKRVAFDPRDLR